MDVYAESSGLIGVGAESFVPQTVHSWLNYQIGSIKPFQIETLCTALNCTPNDLFEWREDNKTVIPEGHALRSLKKSNNHLALRDIPADKLEKLGEMLAQLGDEHE
ncbi:MAG: helix-turn-helix domain-containing protein [Chloracidobacterium sp.]|nr:helix-turn-helix domain-containing protein [Chloracidobacterium sp.]